MTFRAPFSSSNNSHATDQARFFCPEQTTNKNTKSRCPLFTISSFRIELINCSAFGNTSLPWSWGADNICSRQRNGKTATPQRLKGCIANSSNKHSTQKADPSFIYYSNSICHTLTNISSLCASATLVIGRTYYYRTLSCRGYTFCWVGSSQSYCKPQSCPSFIYYSNPICHALTHISSLCALATLVIGRTYYYRTLSCRGATHR